MESEFERNKLRYGLIYGLVCGLAFVVFAWGIDALLLFRANSTYSFLKFTVGLLICVPASGLVGWLTIEQGNHGLALVLWAILAFVLAWLVIWLPVDGTWDIITELNRGLARFLQSGEVNNLWQFRLFTLIITALAAIICGLLEISLVEGALLNPYASSTVSLVAVGVVLFGIAGTACDHMVNSHFREPVVVVDEMLNYARDHQGEEVPREIARKKHLSSVNEISDILNMPHKLTLMKYDQFLGQMEVLVRFNDILVQCTTIYGQPTNCIRISSDS